MTNQVDGQMSLFDPGIWSLKTYPESLPQTNIGTSKRSSRKLSESSGRTRPMFLYLTEDGPSQDASWVTETADARFPSLTDYMTHSFGERPCLMMTELQSTLEHRNGVSESRLSQILEDSPHPRYFLSRKACMGILRRSKEKNKPLPPELESALLAQSERNRVARTESMIGAEQSRTDVGEYVSIEHHPMDSRAKIDATGKIQTLNERMGTGGNNVPLVMRK